MINKKGFTLIELLVTIVIMISILGLAIVSVNKISESRKKVAYESVKEQVVTAAKEYFADNEYFIKGLATTESELGYVSLGTLVNLDYIGTVTNPLNKEKLDVCSYVSVNADGKVEFVDDKTKIAERFSDGNCIMEAAEIETYEKEKLHYVGEPAFTVNVYKKKASECLNEGTLSKSFDYSKAEDVFRQETLWYNGLESSEFYAPNGLYLEIINKSGLEYVFVDNEGREHSQMCITEDNKHEIKIFAKDRTIDDNEYTLVAKLDRAPPRIVATPETSNWTNASKVAVKISITDETSKVKSENRYWNKYGLTQSETTSKNYKWVSTGYTNGGVKKDNNINKEKHEHTEYYSGEGYRKGRIKSCDYAGNCVLDDEYTVKIDKKAPSVSVKTKTSSWTNNDVAYDYSASDKYGLSSLNGYWNKSGLDEKTADSNDCKWQGSSYENSKCSGNHGDNLISSVTTSHSDTGYFKAEGVRKIKFKACDQAGNCKVSKEAIARLDETKPNINSFTIASRSSNYNTYNVNFSWDISEELSYIGKVETNLKNKSGNKLWDRSSKKLKSWNFSSSSSGTYFVVSGKLDGTAVTPNLEACDVAGNCTDKNASRYVVTNFSCSVTKSTKACMSSASNGISGQITVKCNAPTDKITVVYTYGDSKKSVCNVNANTTYQLSGSKNKAVFNFRGCGGYYTLKNIKLAAGASWSESKSAWATTPAWQTTISSWDSKADDGYSSNCNPDRGTYTDYN